MIYQEIELKKAIKRASILALARPLYTFIILLMEVTVSILSLRFIPIMPLFGGVFIGLLISIAVLHSLEEFDTCEPIKD